MKALYGTGIVLLAAGLLGCASTDDSLQRATAITIGSHVPTQRIAISDVDRGMTSVSWTATANGLAYACSADDMVRRPYCSTK